MGFLENCALTTYICYRIHIVDKLVLLGKTRVLGIKNPGHPGEAEFDK